MGAQYGDIRFNNYSIISYDLIGTSVGYGKNDINGQVGKNGCNRDGIKFPESVDLHDVNASMIFNDYKIHAENHFANNIFVSNSDFVKNLVEDERMRFLTQIGILDNRMNELISFNEDVEIFIDPECQLNENKNANIEFERENRTTKVDLIGNLVKVIQNRMVNDVHSIDDRIKGFYINLESSNRNLLHEIILDGYLQFSNIGECEPKRYERQLIHAVYTLRIDVSIDDFKEHVKFLNFLNEFNGKKMNESFEIDRLKNTVEFLRESKKWYSFLDDFKGILHEYGSLGGNDQVIGDLIKNCNITENEMKKVSDIGLNQLLERMNSTIPPVLAETKVDSRKLNALRTILHQSLIDRVRSNCGKNVLVVKGYDVNLSEINRINCEANTVEIFALHKVFIDTDIDAYTTGKREQITIIAPIWEIVGDRKIILNGENGIPHYPLHASNGQNRAENGDDGMPGNPAVSAGHFVAIGNHFINDEYLTIELNGGEGGHGQSGGKGIHANGRMFVESCLEFSYLFWMFFFSNRL